MLTIVVKVALPALVVGWLLRRKVNRREQRVALALLAGGAIWVLEVAVMTNDGFSGNGRYLIMPGAIACVLGGTALGWLIRAVPGSTIRRPLVVGLIAVVAAVGFAIPSLHRLDAVKNSAYYQARLTDGLPGVIARAGGKDRLLACGTPYTGAFQVPAIAWQLGVHTTIVRSASAAGDAPPAVPAVVFRSRTTSTSHSVPAIDSIGGEAAVRTLATGGGWRIVTRCS
jgi:hypothetical protein